MSEHEIESSELDPSEIMRNYAEADRANAEREKLEAETRAFKLQATRDRINIRQIQRHQTFQEAGDTENRVYRFDDEFSLDSCGACYEYLSRWARQDITKPVEIQITSPGGDAWHGMALFDQILALRQQGLHVKITVRGTAASMGAILLQAADERVMGPSSFQLLHKISAVIGGSLDQIEDTKIWLDIIQNRVTDIYVERTGQSKRTVTGWFARKDSSFSPAEALKLGLIDSIG